ncbi:hypothetical protein [Brachybacterium sp. GPGPB12]|uniref:hypothetical protein n=1 Tax=Brachybacterium sp. GPGPB12 TaxID=3023517 RepID=UPI0031345F59
MRSEHLGGEIGAEQPRLATRRGEVDLLMGDGDPRLLHGVAGGERRVGQGRMGVPAHGLQELRLATCDHAQVPHRPVGADQQVLDALDVLGMARPGGGEGRHLVGDVIGQAPLVGVLLGDVAQIPRRRQRHPAVPGAGGDGKADQRVLELTEEGVRGTGLESARVAGEQQVDHERHAHAGERVQHPPPGVMVGVAGMIITSSD